MIYSVWDHANRVYDYYETPRTSAKVNAPKPTHLRSASLGLAPEQAAWPLPSDAKLVGKGKYPRGHIASRGGGLALGILPDLTPTNIALLGALGYMVYTYLWKPRQR